MTGNPSPDFNINKFKVSSMASSQLANDFLKFLDPTVEKLLGLDKIKLMYNNAISTGSSDEQFVNNCLEMVNAKIRFKDKEIDLIPKTGPVIVVCNHPYGGLDGLILYNLLKKVRPDFQIMANNVLKLFPELQKHIVYVNAFTDKNTENLKPLKHCLKHLKNDGLLAVFPAGEVSHYALKKNKVTDGEWNDCVARLAQLSKASVVPIHFSGSNSLLFHAAGFIHPVLRTMMLPRQMLKKDRKIHIRIGSPIKPKEVKQFKDSDELCNFFRLRTYLLNEKPYDVITKRHKKKAVNKKEDIEDIEEAVDPALLEADISSLTPEKHLMDQKDYSVYYGTIQDFPNVIIELGRLREITFREVGEGTGKSLDLDHYDDKYLHLVLWNNKNKEIVGSYRFAPGDRTLRKFGVRGLYTSRFYKYSKDFKEEIKNGLELGRSFIRKEYQKQFAPLLLLWKGICRFIINNPKYYFLFGAVSVSNTYDEKSRFLISQLMVTENTDVKARKKYRCQFKSDADVQTFCNSINLDDQNVVSQLVRSIEKDKDIPILIKQYLKLGGKLYSFTVDDSFGDTLDGLIAVDLRKAPEKTLKMYMENHIEEYKSFHSSHNTHA
ncbi:MAG: lysophospholipid acyltransferase family protein [Lentisphaerales bacterium]|nr:lysophospholipid acyltransferase family protein [Lentisphaerales bacterium]